MAHNQTHDNAPVWVVVLDIAVVNLSLVLAYVLRYRLQWFLDVVYDAPYDAYLMFNALFTIMIPSVLWITGAYRNWRAHMWVNHVSSVLNVVGITLVMTLAIAFVTRPLVYSRLLLLESGVFMAVLMSINRGIAMLVRNRMHRLGKGVRRIVIVGAGEVGRRVMRTVVARPDLGYQIVGYVDDNPEKGEGRIGRFEGLGSIDNLSAIIDNREIDEVIITLPWNYHRRILNVLRECARRDVHARLVPDLFQMSLSRVEVSDLGGVPLMEFNEITFSRSELLLKRIIDLALSILLLLITWPLLLIIAIAIKLSSPGPVFFRQARVGKNHKHFQIYKFRTMRKGAEAELESLRDQNEADGPLFKMRNDPRVTKIGRLLRQTSLDEIPQVINVIRGEMSLVGPRPPIPEEVEEYKSWHKQRLSVPPGITGLWQVSGRSELTFDEMVLLDLYYIEHWSPWVDIVILLRTVPKVLAREGAY